MTKDELITKQQLQIEEYKIWISENEETKRALHGSFYSIGAPLNDNRLKFNPDQLKWIMEVYHKIDRIN